MYELINNTSKFHLYYLIVNDIHEEKYNGLSHVAEHTLLFPPEQKLHFWGKGYTYLNHVCLYFTSNSLNTLKEVDKKVMSGEIITNQNVSLAKQSVTEEIQNLAEDSYEKQQLVSFITDGRIKRFSMGKIEQVAEIQTEDVSQWLREKTQKGNIFRYLFQDAHQMVLSTPISTPIFDPMLMKLKTDKSERTDSVFRNKRVTKATALKIYFKIPLIYKKEDYLKKALFEYCVQKKLNDTLGIDALITDEYFDNNERFSALGFTWNDSLKVVETIESIRQAIRSISLAEFREYKTEYMLLMYDFITPMESNFEVINKIKNWILYGIPRIEKEDLKLSEYITYDCFPREWIAENPLRVTIK